MVVIESTYTTMNPLPTTSNALTATSIPRDQQRFLAIAKPVFLQLQDCTNKLAKGFVSGKQFIAIKIITADGDSKRIGLLTVTDFEPNTGSFDNLPDKHSLKNSSFITSLLGLRSSSDTKARLISGELSEACACRLSGYVSLDKSFDLNKRPVQVPVEVLFIATPPELTQDKTTHLDCVLKSGEFPDQIITADSEIITLAKLKKPKKPEQPEQPLRFKLAQIDTGDLEERLKGLQITSYKYASWSFLQEDSGLRGDVRKHKPLAFRIFSGRADLGEISVKSLLQPNYRLTDADLFKLSLNPVSLTYGSQNLEDDWAIRKALKTTIPREHINTHLICDVKYGPNAPPEVRGKNEELVVLMYGNLDTLNVGYHIATDCSLFSGNSLPKNLIGSGVKLVSSNHINFALERLQEHRFDIACGALMSEDRMSGYKYSIILNGKPIGTMRPVDIEMSNKEFSDKEVLELFRRLNPDEFDDDYRSARAEIERKLLREGSIDEMTSPTARFAFELNENAPEPWKGVTSENLGRLKLKLIGLGKETGYLVNSFYSENKRFRLQCEMADPPTSEASKHFQKLLLGSKDSFEIEIAEDSRLNKKSVHITALPHFDAMTGRSFFRNIGRGGYS
jgi:hypothetical protein